LPLPKLAETKEPLDGNIVDTKIVFEFTKVTVNGSSLDVDRSGTSYSSESKQPAATEIKLTLVPYSRWGNPVMGGMRVWIPGVK
jgi:hypothetical protein